MLETDSDVALEKALKPQGQEEGGGGVSEVEGPPCLRVTGKKEETAALGWVEQPSAALQPAFPLVSRDCFGLSDAWKVGVPAVV